MAHIDYRKWARYYYSLTKRPKHSEVLELAAGEGSMAKFLKKYYPGIIISDISHYMLKQSVIDNRICCNMTSIPIKKKFDLIICAFDSINYLLSKTQVNKLFYEIHNLLYDNGMFSFDASLEKNSIKNAEYLNTTGQYKNYTYVQKSMYNRVTRIHTNYFEISDMDGTLVKEEHKQKIYPVEMYFDLIGRNKMYVKNCFDAFTFRDAGPDSERVQFIVCKDSGRC